jgi:hypothetical protein
MNTGVEKEELVTLKKSELEKICETVISLKRRVSELEKVYGSYRNKGSRRGIPPPGTLASADSFPATC